MRGRAHSILLVVLACAGCVFSPTSEVSKTFCGSELVSAAAGGTVSVTAPECAALAGTSVVIPPGALAQDTVVTIGMGPDAIASAWATGIGPVADFGPSGTRFTSPVTVTLPFDASGILDTDLLFVQEVEANGTTGRIDRPDLQILPSGKSLSFQITAFTQFEVALDPSCGNCPAGSSCAPGTHRCACTGGLYACTPSGPCIDLRVDSNNCGSCGNVCPTGYMCDIRHAGPVDDAGAVCSCGAGTFGDCADGCVDLATDSSNCGACGNVCPLGYTCVGASCANTCGGGLTPCASSGGFSCVDLQSDPLNCGSCGNGCDFPGAAACVGRQCTCSDSSLTACGRACVDLATDPSNCGTCAKACPIGYACAGAQCVNTCSAGLTPCASSSGFSCLDLQSDRNNCGACHNSCQAEHCSGGVCRCAGGKLYCPKNDLECLPVCVAESDRNCGKCNHKCTGGQHCLDGGCS
jgi:hypothetical protein